MNTSFNVVVDQANPETIVETLKLMGAEAIVNGPAWSDALTGEKKQMVTILNCSRDEFRKFKNRKALRHYFQSKACF